MSLEILIGRPSANAIVVDHLDNAPRVRGFLSHDPGALESYEARAEDVDRRFGANREHLAGMLRATSEGSAGKLRALADGTGLAVTTGHQAGLFGGPLMGLYKLLSTVRLARDLESALDRPVAPIFWVAADDHDWDEVRRATLLTPQNEVAEIALPPASPDAPAPPMSERVLGPEVDDALEALGALLPPNDFRDRLLAMVRSAYRPDATAAAAFGDLLAELVGRFDVLLVDPSDATVRARAAPVLRDEIEHAEAHDRIFANRSRELLDAGYGAQIPVLDGGTGLHFMGPLGRERVFMDGDGFRLRASGTRLGRAELLRAAEEPGRLTAGVGLRPILESAILPTVAYVGGPAEVAYFAQIEPLFDEHGVSPQVVVPRYTVTLVEAKTRKVLDRFGLAPGDFDRPAHEIGARILREELPEDVRDALKSLRAALGQGYGSLSEAAERIDPTLRGAIGSARNSALHGVGELEKRIAQHSDAQREIGLQQLRKAEINLFPAGRPQERILNSFQYLARYGVSLLDDVLAAMGPLVGAGVAG
ncbi:MAG: bacillithiol biosynthesis cysteine-adding enzyme BshC [Gemmatimonadota bacterium]